MNNLWFKRWGWVYRPASAAGWLVTFAAVAFCANVFVAIDRQSHSVSDTLYHFYTYAAPTFLGLMWIASRTCTESHD